MGEFWGVSVICSPPLIYIRHQLVLVGDLSRDTPRPPRPTHHENGASPVLAMETGWLSGDSQHLLHNPSSPPASNPSGSSPTLFPPHSASHSITPGGFMTPRQVVKSPSPPSPQGDSGPQIPAPTPHRAPPCPVPGCRGVDSEGTQYGEAGKRQPGDAEPHRVCLCPATPGESAQPGPGSAGREQPTQGLWSEQTAPVRDRKWRRGQEAATAHLPLPTASQVPTPGSHGSQRPLQGKGPVPISHP